VRNVMIENIDKVLERGDRLELLVDKTANMQGNTFRFRKQARRFSSAVWWRNVKLTYVLQMNCCWCLTTCMNVFLEFLSAFTHLKPEILEFLAHWLIFFASRRVALILLLLVIIYVVLAVVCHGVTLPTCRK
jgi:vesicle-associated membrane protein 7